MAHTVSGIGLDTVRIISHTFRFSFHISGTAELRVYQSSYRNSVAHSASRIGLDAGICFHTFHISGTADSSYRKSEQPVDVGGEDRYLCH